MAQAKKKTSVSEAGPSDKVRFDYEKGRDFRVVHVDGFVGGPTPSGDILIGFYNQRFPFPDSVTQEVSDTGKLGRELEIDEGRSGIIRELEVGLVMRPQVVRNLLAWIEAHVEGLDQLEKWSPWSQTEGEED